jgi:hypothetical protein
MHLLLKFPALIWTGGGRKETTEAATNDKSRSYARNGIDMEYLLTLRSYLHENVQVGFVVLQKNNKQNGY